MESGISERPRWTATVVSLTLALVLWLVVRPAVGAWWDRLLIGVLAAHVVVVFFHGPEWQQRWYLTMFGAISAAAGIALAIAVVVS